jgi:phenylalanyl-tRNA synthetase beta chain
MGYNAIIINNSKIRVEIPRWRADILHNIDLVEDVSVGYGFEKFEIDFPNDLTFGKSLPMQNIHENFRKVMFGLGFNEITTFTISNERDEFSKFGLDIDYRIQIENPIGEDYSCLRVGLLPSLLKILSENRHHPLPQKIFELGIIVNKSALNQTNLAALKIDAKANFTECKSIVDAVMRDIGIKFDIDEKLHPGFINGRCASIIYKNKIVGLFGELHPKTITDFGLEHPIIGFEFQIDDLYR